MRILMSLAGASALLAATALHVPALAQTPPAATPAAPGTTPGIAAPAPAGQAATSRPGTAGQRAARRQTLSQRYEAANTTHDGHLTKDQATAARWPYIARNFDAMDKDRKGYVSVDDIRAYAATQRAARRTATPATTTPPAGTTAPAKS